MARHVDAVKSDWLAGVQRAVARVEPDEQGQMHVAPEHFRDQLPVLSPGGDPREAFEHLHDRLDGTYLSATRPHDDHDCPFRDGQLVELVGTPTTADKPPVGIGNA